MACNTLPYKIAALREAHPAGRVTILRAKAVWPPTRPEQASSASQRLACGMKASYFCGQRPTRRPTMPVVEKRTFSLPAAQASYIDALVEAGTYASASEVVRAGLRALQERDAAVERWLREAVVPTYDAMQADPGRGLSADQVTAALAAHHAARLKKAGRDA
jgi:antitoxin ParD1/3/4